jgi:hypothetical protein
MRVRILVGMVLARAPEELLQNKKVMGNSFGAG